MPTSRHTTPDAITQLADYVRLHHTSVADLRAAAVEVDRGTVDGDPHLMLALTASVLEQSAARTLLELYVQLDWTCEHDYGLADSCPCCD